MQAFRNSTLALSRRAVTAPLRVAPASVARYHAKVIDHYENPRNVGKLDKNDADVGTGLVGAPGE